MRPSFTRIKLDGGKLQVQEMTLLTILVGDLFGGEFCLSSENIEVRGILWEYGGSGSALTN